MNKEEFTYWQAKTESSRFQWTEDEIFRLNGRGAFYYIGGGDGQYIEIAKDGLLTVGVYEGAFPHIGETFFTPGAQKQCGDFNRAFETALAVGGKKFLEDMFGGNMPFSPAKGEKASVTQQLKAARHAPPIRNEKEPHTPKKSKDGLEL